MVWGKNHNTIPHKPPDKQERNNKKETKKMKKLIMTLALIAGTMCSVASTDVYAFKTTLKYPAVGATAFVGAKTAVVGTLTIETDEEGANPTATLVVTLKKTKATYTMTLDSETAYAVFGKKGTDCATTLKFVNVDPSEGLTELTFYGWGTLKTKKTGGCTPCGDTTAICFPLSIKFLTCAAKAAMNSVFCVPSLLASVLLPIFMTIFRAFFIASFICSLMFVPC